MRLIPGDGHRFRGIWARRPGVSCSALHPMGFFVPRRSLDGRWALTPPFHPYPPALRRAGGLFSATLSVAPGFGRTPPRILRGMVPGGVRTFLCMDFEALAAITGHRTRHVSRIRAVCQQDFASHQTEMRFGLVH